MTWFRWKGCAVPRISHERPPPLLRCIRPRYLCYHLQQDSSPPPSVSLQAEAPVSGGLQYFAHTHNHFVFLRRRGVQLGSWEREREREREITRGIVGGSRYALQPSIHKAASARASVEPRAEIGELERGRHVRFNHCEARGVGVAQGGW